MEATLWAKRLSRIGEQFSQCEPVELVMIREAKPVNGAAHKAALADVLGDADYEGDRLGEFRIQRTIRGEPVSIEELARRHARQSRIRRMMLDACPFFGWGDVKIGSICFYAPALLTMPIDDLNRVWQKLDEMFNAAGGVLEIVPENVRSQLSPMALSLENRKLRWAGCLFDIALRHLPGMTHTDQTYLQGQEPSRDRPDPGCWSATLKNVMTSSVELIDWLIAAADVPKRETEATSETVKTQAETLTGGGGAVEELQKTVASLVRQQKKQTKPLTKTEKTRNQRIKFCCPRRRKKSPDTWNEIYHDYAEKFPNDKTASPDTLLHSHDRNCLKCREQKS